MAPSKATPVNVYVEVTPRFEIFYALQVLEGGVWKDLAGWRRDAEAMLSPRVRTAISSVAPAAIMWPLIADALRDAPAGVTFDGMLAILGKMSPLEFQNAVLSGVFKAPRSVNRLISGIQSLGEVVQTESATRGKLLSLLGLNPFTPASASARAFERIVRDPAAYKAEVVNVIASFWKDCFRETWQMLQPDMQRVATRMREAVDEQGFDTFARERNLPVVGDPASTIYLIPSAFNASRLWASYAGARGRRRFFIPILDAALSLDVRSESRRDEAEQAEQKATPAKAHVDPSLVFKALGDTTRYAMASAIARAPMTSVELARMFGVSKPTISHHVQALRAAQLLIEEPADNGVVLSLNRAVLEHASADAATGMFSAQENADIVKRTRKTNRRQRKR
jgi:DNA-binding transcriptional ArsR family regulator